MMMAQDFSTGLALARTFRFLREHGLDYFERQALTAREFTALLPLRRTRQHDQLERALERFADHARSPLASIPGVHCARWVLLDAGRSSVTGDLAAADGDAASTALLFSTICDGWPLDMLEELAENDALDQVLRHCEGTEDKPTPQGRVAYLRAHRLRSTYLFSDTRQRDADAPHLPISAREIVRALELRAAFCEFASKYPSGASGTREAFSDFQVAQFGKPGPLERKPAPGYPFPPSVLERSLEQEGVWIRRTADLVRARARRDVRARRRAGLTPAGLRQVHAKHSDMVAARFRVSDDLPEEFEQGVFIRGAQYEAWLRTSSTSPAPQPDYMPDGRGLSLKLREVEGRGRRALADAPPEDVNSAAVGKLNQDFVLVSNPTFFMKNARDYAILRSLLDANPDGLRERAGLLAGTLLFFFRRPLETRIFLKTLLRLCRHPLGLEYHSMVPIALGPHDAAKISIGPTPATRAALRREPLLPWLMMSLLDPSNYLRAALEQSLDRLDDSSVLELELVAHVEDEDSLPIEDPRIDWRQLGARRIVLGKVTIPRQKLGLAERLVLGERAIFTPWHTLLEHRTLGSLSRSRLFAYLVSAEERAQPVEPSAALAKKRHLQSASSAAPDGA